MICPNLNDKTVKQQFTELVNAVGEVAAYDIWNQNNGNAIDKAPNGAESKLFSDLLNYYNGDRNSAIKAKAQIYSRSFKNKFGDWLNGNNEPSLSSIVQTDTNISNTITPSDPSLRERLFNGKDEASIGVMLTRLAKSSPALVPFINKVKANIPVNVKARKIVLIPYNENNPSHAWYDTDNGVVYISENAAYEHNGRLSKADNTIFHEMLHLYR